MEALHLFYRGEMYSCDFSTPILIIAWRRPKHLNRVIQAIKVVSPKYIFVAIDGPRVGQEFEEERKRIEEVKEVIDSKINWDCEVKKLYRTNNLGCAKGVSGAITWFFKHVEQGIILEDDIVITPAGLEFFEWGLNRFKESDKIWMLSAWNPYRTYNISIIQKYFYCWGWATWKSTWQQYSLEIPEPSVEYSKIQRVNNYWKVLFSKVVEIDTWDYSLQYWMFKNKAKALLAPKNYIENIGFDSLGVHTTDALPEQFKIPVNDDFKVPIVLGISNLKSDKWDFETVRFGNLTRNRTPKVFFNQLVYKCSRIKKEIIVLGKRLNLGK
jgi:hypothetical protein